MKALSKSRLTESPSLWEWEPLANNSKTARLEKGHGIPSFKLQDCLDLNEKHKCIAKSAHLFKISVLWQRGTRSAYCIHGFHLQEEKFFQDGISRNDLIAKSSTLLSGCMNGGENVVSPGRKRLEDLQTCSRSQWESKREAEAAPEDFLRMSSANPKEASAGKKAWILKSPLPSLNSSLNILALLWPSTAYVPALLDFSQYLAHYLKLKTDIKVQKAKFSLNFRSWLECSLCMLHRIDHKLRYAWIVTLHKTCPLIIIAWYIAFCLVFFELQRLQKFRIQGAAKTEIPVWILGQ